MTKNLGGRWGAAQRRVLNCKATARRAGVLLEAFEPRTLLSAVYYVVGDATPRDATHFRLITDALAAAVAGDTVQLEPGAFAAAGTVTISAGLTLQGDPAVPATSNLPLALTVAASNVTLNNLSLTTVSVNAGVNNLTVEHSLVNSVTETAAATGNGSNTYLDDKFTGTLVLRGNTQAGAATNDLVDDSSFASAQPVVIDISHADGTILRSNTIQGAALTQIGIALNSSQNVNIHDNIIHLGQEGPGSAGTIAIQITNSDSAATQVNLTNNTLATDGRGTGLVLLITAGANYSVLAQGNDFHGNFTGVAITGDGSASATALGNIDLGGGAQSSVGGNNFRSFDGTTARSYAITVTNAQSVTNTVFALNDIFATGVSPALVIKDATHNSGTGTINVTTELDVDHAFVQLLYHHFLGRSASMGELNSWVTLLPTLGRGGISSAIGRSTEALQRVVDKIYLNYLGRHAEASGLNSWVALIQGGGTVDQVRQGVLASAEYAARTPMDFVQSLYLRLLNRVAAPAELLAWDNSGLTHTQIAHAFLQAPEYLQDAVQDDYQGLLHRTPSTADVNAWLATGMDLYSIRLAIAGTDEFAKDD